VLASVVGPWQISTPLPPLPNNADLPLICPKLTPGIAEQQGHVVQTSRGFKEYNMSLISNSPIVALS
jgi:hypothetical protein